MWKFAKIRQYVRCCVIQQNGTLLLTISTARDLTRLHICAVWSGGLLSDQSTSNSGYCGWVSFRMKILHKMAVPFLGSSSEFLWKGLVVLIWTYLAKLIHFTLKLVLRRIHLIKYVCGSLLILHWENFGTLHLVLVGVMRVYFFVLIIVFKNFHYYSA